MAEITTLLEQAGMTWLARMLRAVLLVERLLNLGQVPDIEALLDAESRRPARIELPAVAIASSAGSTAPGRGGVAAPGTSGPPDESGACMVRGEGWERGSLTCCLAHCPDILPVLTARWGSLAVRA